MLQETHNWGAFLFFAGACLLSIVYVFFVVPETSGMSVEQLNQIFEGPWYTAYKRSKSLDIIVASFEGDDEERAEHK